MNLEDLKNKIAELIGSPGSNKELAFEIFTRNIAENLDYNQAIKIPELGVFQLKKAEEGAAEKSSLIFAPLPEAEGEGDAGYLTIDIDVKKSEDFEFDDNVFSLGADKPIISSTQSDDLDDERTEIEELLQKSIEENTADILAEGERIDGFEIWEDMDKLSEFTSEKGISSEEFFGEKDDQVDETEAPEVIRTKDLGIDDSLRSFDDLNFTSDFDKDMDAEISEEEGVSSIFETFSDEDADGKEDIKLDWDKELGDEAEAGEPSGEESGEDFFSLLDDELAEKKEELEEESKTEFRPEESETEEGEEEETSEEEPEHITEDIAKDTEGEDDIKRSEAEETESLKEEVTEEIKDESKFDFSALEDEEEIEIGKTDEPDELAGDKDELPEPGLEGLPGPEFEEKAKKDKDKVDVSRLSSFQSLKHQPKRSMGGMAPKVLAIAAALIIIILLVYFFIFSGNGTTMEPENNIPGYEQQTPAQTGDQSPPEEGTQEQQPPSEDVRKQVPEIKEAQKPPATVTQQPPAGSTGRIQLENKPLVVFENGVYSLQISSWPDKAKADTEARKLVDKGVDAFVATANLGDKGIWYRVRVGKFNSEAEANRYSSEKFK